MSWKQFVQGETFFYFLGERYEVNSTYVKLYPIFLADVTLLKAGWHGGFVVSIWDCKREDEC